MTALKEIKARIASVQGTLKITSAMKMVASAKLHHIQASALSLAEYGRRLSDITMALHTHECSDMASPWLSPHDRKEHATVVAFSSDNSLCGSFNVNAVKAMTQQIETLSTDGFKHVTVIPVGTKMLQATTKAGYDTDKRFHSLCSKPSYESVSMLADMLMEEYATNKTDKTVLVYNHFLSMGHQEPVHETFLPMAMPIGEEQYQYAPEYICEPEVEMIMKALLPHTLRTRLYSVLLDSVTAEQAARTIAMQTATDNARGLLNELSLTYNKRRQQAITDELADITTNG